MKITQQQIDVGPEVTAWVYATEASTLRFPPGRWPRVLQSDPTVGNGQPLLLQVIHRDRDGDITCATYQQALGIIKLNVYND